MNTKQTLREITTELRKMRKVEQEIIQKNKSAPKGKLRCAAKGNSFQYYLGEKYLDKTNKKLVADIANREYREKLLTVLRERIKVYERLEHLYHYDFHKPEEVYANLHPARKKIVKPLYIPRDEFIRNWQEESYEHWEITDADVRGNFITDRGERVRSKSEKIIADTLLKHGIPYKYEYPLQLKDNDRKVVIRPDFVVLSLATLEEMIIEHLGMMDDEQYYIRSMNKIDLYEKNGYLIGQKLILLHETFDNPLDTRIMDKYIIAYLTDVSK